MTDSLSHEHLRFARALAIVARVNTVIAPAAFAELATALRELVGPCDLAITRSDAPGSFRVLASTRGDRDTLIPLRTLLASGRKIYDSLYVKRVPYVAKDLEAGSELEKATARHGFGAAAAFPISESDHSPVVGALVAAFRDSASVDSPAVGSLEDFAKTLGASVSRGLLEGQKERALRILEASGDALVAWDADGRITDVNRALESLVGAARHELVGRSIRELFGVVPTAQVGGQPLRLLSRDNSRLTVAATVSSGTGDPLVAGHAMLRDMSDVVAAEQDAADRLAQLHEVTEQHMVLLDNAPLLIFRIDPESHEVLYLNRHAEHLFGVPAAHALSTPGFLRDAHVDQEGSIAFEEAVVVAKLGQVMPPYEARLRREGGDTIVARGTIYPIMNEAGRVVGVEGILLDVTNERAVRSRLLQADRLATVGLLAAGVAHEINNPAAFMLLGLDLLARTLNASGSSPAQAEQLLVDLRDTARRIVDIARDLRTFASPVTGNKKALVDVSRAIESALTITRAQIVEKADVEKSVEEDLPMVAIEEGRLGQVLVNLLVNAAQSVAEAKRSRGERGIDIVRIDAFTEGKDVVIVVQDTGQGIRPELLERIFVPFYTTKQAGLGTGLGLAITKTLVEGAGGSITVESPSRLAGGTAGAAFTIRLPRAVSLQETPPPNPVVSAPRKRTSILIVDDEVLLGRLLCEEFSKHHEATHVASAEEALQLLASGTCSVEVVFCDLKMPSMGGEEFFRAVEAQHPRLVNRFVFMTGVGFAPELGQFLAQVKAPLLEKPFAVDAALELVEEVRQR